MRHIAFQEGMLRHCCLEKFCHSCIHDRDLAAIWKKYRSLCIENASSLNLTNRQTNRQADDVFYSIFGPDYESEVRINNYSLWKSRICKLTSIFLCMIFFQIAAKSRSWVRLRQNFFKQYSTYALFKCNKSHSNRLLYNKLFSISKFVSKLMGHPNKSKRMRFVTRAVVSFEPNE